MTKNSAYGVYYIFKSMEQGPTFRISMPKYPKRTRTAASCPPAQPFHALLLHIMMSSPPNGDVLGLLLPFRPPIILTATASGRNSTVHRSLPQNDNAFLAVDDVARCRPPPTD
jgi:hypothetical protein